MGAHRELLKRRSHACSCWCRKGSPGKSSIRNSLRLLRSAKRAPTRKAGHSWTGKPLWKDRQNARAVIERVSPLLRENFTLMKDAAMSAATPLCSVLVCLEA